MNIINEIILAFIRTIVIVIALPIYFISILLETIIRVLTWNVKCSSVDDYLSHRIINNTVDSICDYLELWRE